MNRLFIALSLLAAAPTLAQPRIISLGSQDASARSVSADGRVIAGTLEGNYYAFRWTQETGLVVIGGYGTKARAISADGSTIVGTDNAGPGWMWTQQAGMTPIALPDHGVTYIYGVNHDGSVLGGYAYNEQTAILDAFLYHPADSTFTILPAPPACSVNYVYTVSPDGLKAAGSVGNGAFTRASLWNPPDVNNPVGSPDGRRTVLRGLTPSGSAVVGQIYTSYAASAYLWTADGGAQDLGNPPGLTQGLLWAVNANATLAGGTALEGSENRAVIWCRGESIMEAEDYLAARGVDLADWELEYIYAMTPDGRVLVGGGGRGGADQAFAIYLPCGDADFDNDGAPGTDSDIEAFFACLAGDCCPLCQSPDFNGDGGVATDADIEAFFRVLAGQPC
jgi:uncharacterized membrane protein